MKWFRFFSVVLCAVLCVVPCISRAEFDPNYILDDSDLFEISGMSQKRVQELLSSKGTLGTYRTQDIDGKEHSASEIIWRVATSYKINPKYLLALMQKEQSLVEDPSPTQKQFDWATGYGVCDSCSMDDPSIQGYKGFANQLEWAAKQHREKYLLQLLGKGKTISGYMPGKAFLIDGERVTPHNNATAMLYSYTPHIHGNKNLWNIWQRWFSVRFPEGTVVESLPSKKIYLMSLGEKRPFATRAVAMSMVDSAKIVQASDKDIEGYAVGGTIRFPNFTLVETPSKKRYLLANGEKRLIVSRTAFQKLGFNEDEVVDVREEDLANYSLGKDLTSKAKYPTGQLVRDPKKQTWYVEDGVKHLVPHTSLLSLYFKGQPVKQVATEQIKSYPIGDPLKLRDGELVRAKESPSVYVIERGEKHPFPSGDVFVDMGYAWRNVITLPKTVLDTYPIGASIEPYRMLAEDTDTIQTTTSGSLAILP